MLAGALLGFAYWRFIGCASGACPITSNWHISTLYGALVGATFLLPSRTRAGKNASPPPAAPPPTEPETTDITNR